MTTISNPREELPALTGLRFIAAMSVAIAHSRGFFWPAADFPNAHWLSSVAGFGMTLFFVLSGFVIHYNYNIPISTGGIKGFREFMWVRFARLYPLFVLVLLFDFLLGADLVKYFSTSPDLKSLGEATSALSIHLLMIQSWIYVPYDSQSLIYRLGYSAPLTWSISTEWFFYLSYPLIAACLLRLKSSWRAITAIVIFCGLWIWLAVWAFNNISNIDLWAIEKYGPVASFGKNTQDSFVRWILYFSPYLRIGEFILGGLVAHLFMVLRDRPVGLVERRIGVAFLLLALCSQPLQAYLMYGDNHSVPILRQMSFNFSLAPSVAIIIFCSVRYRSWISSALSTKPMIAGGEASYSIYLVHMVTLVAMTRVMAGGSVEATTSGMLFLAAKQIFVLAIIVLVSLGLHKIYEEPARRWMRNLRRQDASINAKLGSVFIFVLPAIVALQLSIWGSFLSSSVRPRAMPTKGIKVDSATYGANCGAPLNNALRHIETACDGKDSCQYVVDVKNLGDPAQGCGKSYILTYQCLPEKKSTTLILPGEAGLGAVANLSCAAQK